MDHESWLEVRRSKIRSKLLKAAGCDVKGDYYLHSAAQLLLRVAQPERKDLIDELNADPKIKQQFIKMLRLCDIGG